MLSGEATNTNFIDFGLTQPGLEPTIYRTLGEHANHYATDAEKVYKTSIVKNKDWKELCDQNVKWNILIKEGQ